MPGGYVGRSPKRLEDPPLLTGRGRYLDDLGRDALAVVFLRSTHAHARLLEVDARPALAAPGVVGILTGEEAAGRVRPIRAELAAPGYQPTDWPVLARGKVRFVGEPVAAVVATDRYRGEDALERIRVQYQALAAVTTLEQGLAPDAPRLHEELPDNVLFHARFDNGLTEAAFAEAEVRFEATFRHGRCAGVPLEPRGMIAAPDPETGGLVVWASTQAPHILRSGLAATLGLPESRIRVRAPDVGGGFGPKMHLFPEDVAVASLALELGRPLKWVETRTENLMAGAHARELVGTVEVAARRDGTLLGLRARLGSDVGAYSIYPLTVALEPVTAAGMVPGPYRLRGYSYEARAVATNKCPTGAYRGVGMALATFVRERLVEMLARRIGLDPAEVGRRNMVGADEFPYTMASGLVFDSGSPAEALERLLEVAGYAALRRQQAAGTGPRRRGIGIASYTEFTGMGPGTFRRRGMIHVPGYDAATVRVEATGEARAFVSAAAQGQGHRTTLAQVLADELGLRMEDVAIVAGDTERCPPGSGAFASRSMVSAGGALVLAARRVREKVLAIAAHLLEAAPADLALADGEVSVRGAPSRRLAVREVARVAYRPAAATLPAGLAPGLEATEVYEPPPATFSNGAHLAVVDVDVETGRVELLRHVVVEDCGRVINPVLVEGQVHGAVAQGVGNALHEELCYDGAGQPLSASLMEYHLPTAAELPPIEIAHVETLPPVSVAGFKGMAEGGAIGATAAVANAVADALAPLGVEVLELPLTPSRVFRLLAVSRPGP
jgi:carbon-monoxide dehydrogenase large subunit